MTIAEFKAKAEAKMAATPGLTDREVIVSDELVVTSCRLRGKMYEMSYHRGSFDDRMMAMVLVALDNFAADVAGLELVEGARGA